MVVAHAGMVDTALRLLSPFMQTSVDEVILSCTVI